ncbi:hypothetical protein BH10ACT3_BH10ACT3_05460 [soil metagenome]
MTLKDATLRCWGSGNWGKLGNGQNVTNRNSPTAVANIADSRGVEVGGNVSCSLADLAGTSARCWGYNGYNQLFSGATWLGSARAISGPYAVELSVGHRHTCILITDGRVSCWGNNQGGQLGRGSVGGVALASDWVQNIANAVMLDVGHSYSCAGIADGTVSCWGGPDALGGVPVAGVDDVEKISAGGDVGCAVRSDRRVLCWTGGTSGSPATGANVVSGIDDAVDVSVGEGHSCALKANGTVACWGAGVRGQLGNGVSVDSAVPVVVAGLTDVVALAAGGVHSCAVRADGNAYCWGGGQFGQLGNGSDLDSSVPVAVYPF